jgi:tellurite methyltransferase
VPTHGEDAAADPRTRWNTRYAGLARDPTAPPSSPSRFLTDRAELVPRTGRALDVAGGRGADSVWLATRGLDVTLVDVADAACAEATAQAVAAGVALDVVRAELGADPLPSGPWDVILVHHWLDRRVWTELPAPLAPGGLLLACQPTVRNLERHDRPGRRWLLADDELPDLVAAMQRTRPGLEVVDAAVGWTAEGRHEAQLVARVVG